MTQDHLMMRNFSGSNKQIDLLPYTAYLSKNRNALLGKCTAAIFSVIVDCNVLCIQWSFNLAYFTLYNFMSTVNMDIKKNMLQTIWRGIRHSVRLYDKSNRPGFLRVLSKTCPKPSIP